MSRRRNWSSYREFFPRSRRIEAKGGIKAQTRSGQFGKSWWAQRWIRVLESFNLGARLSRGRSYARSGQVLTIDITKGKVKAKVQGSRSTPYDITIAVAPLNDADWKKVTTVLASRAAFAAKLLAGEMPNDIETAFDDAKVSLFPKTGGDLKTDCSCPDWSNPCKHIAAVYYLLGEEFDRDPFLIFKLRGLTRDELIPRLGSPNESDEAEPTPPKKAKGKRPESTSAADKQVITKQTGRPETSRKRPAKKILAPPEPLPTSAEAYWKPIELPSNFFGEIQTPPSAATLLRRLGAFPFWRGEQPLPNILDPFYDAAACAGLDVFLGQSRETG